MNEQARDKQIRLVLLDHLELFRASLARLLGSESDLEVVADCGASVEALEILRASIVDMVLLDFEVGADRGNDFIFAARQAGYQGQFLIVTGLADARSSAIALKLGASGIFLKSESPARLVQAIRLVESGGIWIDRGIIRLLADELVEREPQLEPRGPGGPLEDREREVLRGIVGGLTNRKIGCSLGLTESTVKNVVQRLFGKAGVKTRSQLVRVTLEGSLRATRDFVDRHAHEKPEEPPVNSPEEWRPPDAGIPVIRSHQ